MRGVLEAALALAVVTLTQLASMRSARRGYWLSVGCLAIALQGLAQVVWKEPDTHLFPLYAQRLTYLVPLAVTSWLVYKLELRESRAYLVIPVLTIIYLTTEVATFLFCAYILPAAIR